MCAWSYACVCDQTLARKWRLNRLPNFWKQYPDRISLAKALQYYARTQLGIHPPGTSDRAGSLSPRRHQGTQSQRLLDSAGHHSYARRRPRHSMDDAPPMLTSARDEDIARGIKALKHALSKTKVCGRRPPPLDLWDNPLMAQRGYM